MAERTYAALPYEYLDEMEELNDAEFGRLARALLRYSMTGEPIALSGNERFYAKRVMNREDRYQENHGKKQDAGAKGGSKRKQPQAEESNCKQSQADESKTDNTKAKAKAYAKTYAKTNTPPSGEEGSNGAVRPTAFATEELRSAFADWLAYKQERREAYKPTGLKNLESEVRNNAAKYGESAVAALIRHCMASNWKGIIFEQLEQKCSRSASTPPRPQAEQQQSVQEDMARMRRMLDACREQPS